MTLKRILWTGLGLAVGLGLALLYTWVISPVQYIDTAPNSLRADYQAAYAQLAARAYAVDGDLGRARTRLTLLGMRDPGQGAAALAQHAAGSDPAGAQALAALASALQGTPAVPTATAPAATPAEGSPAAATPAEITPEPSASATNANPTPTDTPRPTDTVVPSITPNLLPTRTPSPTPLAAFVFVGQQQVCDPKLGQPLIQVVTESAAGQQLPGVEVDVVWDSGFDHFFTGLKPDLGAGYGDFTMTSGVVYSVHLAESPAVVIDHLTAESCAGSGATSYLGSVLLIFKQPR
jgi:hypothetical protein